MMLFSPLESLLNRGIADSATAQGLCRRLKDRTLAVRLTGTDFTLFFHSDGDRLTLSRTHAAKADASISGSPVALFGLALKSPESQIRAGRVHIEGDAEVAQTFQNLLKAARPDPEEELSRLVGDFAAHQAGTFARTAAGFGRRAVDTLGQNITEYLQEESRDLPARLEVNEFLAEVDRLRDAVERAEARLALLERRSA